MPNKNTATTGYMMGYSDDFQRLLKRRSAATNAAYLLPHLKPGMRVLDFGCGPGTISVGLAKAVEPGELHGIDMEESQIEIARNAASAGGHKNAIFRKGDIADLPFEDNFFDVAHCHAVLIHITDVEAVLNEVKRVLKPGGIISSREMFVDSSFFEPEIKGGAEAFSKFMSASGGHPQMGKKLKRLFFNAGFSDIDAKVSLGTYGTAEDIRFLHDFMTAWLLSSSTVRTAEKYGVATERQLKDWCKMLDRWRDDPGAIAGFAWGEAIGRKP